MPLPLSFNIGYGMQELVYTKEASGDHFDGYDKVHLQPLFSLNAHIHIASAILL